MGLGCILGRNGGVKSKPVSKARQDARPSMKEIVMKKFLTRRGLLQGMGAGAAAAAFPFRAISAGPAVISPVTAKLAAYMSEAREHALPADVVENAKYHILDTF